MRKAEVAAWTKEWNLLFQEESVLLHTVFDKEMITVHHIGSTSIPNIGFAKPTIDIVIEVGNIDIVDKYNSHMEEIGYSVKGENGIPKRRYFTKGGDQRTHHVHIHEYGDDQINSHLNFKRYLNCHPNEAREYGKLKCRLALEFRDNIHLYQSGKEEFVNELVSKSKEWAEQQKK